MTSEELIKKVAEVAPDKYKYIIKAASEIKDSPFKEEVMERLDGLVKKAADMSRWARFAQSNPMASKALGALGAGAAGVGGAALSGVAFSLAGDMYDASKRGLTKSRDFKHMLQENPDLKSLPGKQVERAFSVLHRFNPEYASDPVVAGSFVRRGANFADEGMFADPKMIGDLVNSRKNLHDLKKLPAVPQIPHGYDKKLKKMEFESKSDPNSVESTKNRNQSELFAEQAENARGQNDDRARKRDMEDRTDSAEGLHEDRMHDWLKSDRDQHQQDKGPGNENAAEHFHRLFGRYPGAPKR